jgi:hypothetical protein
MKRFIYLKDEICSDVYEFAFYCTVKDEFEEFNGCQTWDDIKVFEQDMRKSGEPEEQIQRRLNLIPKGIRLGVWEESTIYE